MPVEIGSEGCWWKFHETPKTATRMLLKAANSLSMLKNANLCQESYSHAWLVNI